MIESPTIEKHLSFVDSKILGAKIYSDDVPQLSVSHRHYLRCELIETLQELDEIYLTGKRHIDKHGCIPDTMRWDMYSAARAKRYHCRKVLAAINAQSKYDKQNNKAKREEVNRQVQGERDRVFIGVLLDYLFREYDRGEIESMLKKCNSITQILTESRKEALRKEVNKGWQGI